MATDFDRLTILNFQASWGVDPGKCTPSVRPEVLRSVPELLPGLGSLLGLVLIGNVNCVYGSERLSAKAAIIASILEMTVASARPSGSMARVSTGIDGREKLMDVSSLATAVLEKMYDVVPGTYRRKSMNAMVASSRSVISMWALKIELFFRECIDEVKLRGDQTKESFRRGESESNWIAKRENQISPKRTKRSFGPTNHPSHDVTLRAFAQRPPRRLQVS